MVELGRALRWSPDGSQIAFVRPGSSAGDSLWVARSDGGSPREVVPLRGGMHIHWPVWSHDGRHIYFNYSISTANREPASIYRVPAAGGPVEPVVVTPRRAVFPFPTPDGSGVVYAANPNSVDLALWWRPLSGGDPIRLTTGVGEYSEPSITSDGRTMISSLVQFHQTLTVFTMNPGAASPPQPITNGSTGRYRSGAVAERPATGLQLVAIRLSESVDGEAGRLDASRVDVGQCVRRAAGVLTRRETTGLRL